MDLISREAVKAKAQTVTEWTWQTGKFIGLADVDSLPSAFDGMTNGEVIKALFPDSYFLNDFPFSASSMEKIYIDNNKDNKTHIMVQEDWWNAPYKAEREE